MSAAENKKLKQEIFAGLAAGDNSSFRRSVTGRFRIVVMGRSSWSQTVEGDALRKYQEYVRARFGAPGKTVPEGFIADGDIVADRLLREGARPLRYARERDLAS